MAMWISISGGALLARVGKKPSRARPRPPISRTRMVMTIPRMKLRISRSSEHFTGELQPRTNSSSLYLQGRGNRADASAKVVTDNETDCVFPGGEIQGTSVANAVLTNRRQLFRGQM